MATVLQEHIVHAQGLNAAMAHLAAQLRAATVEVRVQGHGSGSGVVWREDGLIITNNHVVHGDVVDVVLAGGAAVRGQVVDRNPAYDLAAVRIEAHDLKAAPIGDSSKLRVGELVLAMGHPLGVTGALSVGIVHMVPSRYEGDMDEQWIRADLSLLPGNSGGPLVDARGNVIGVNSMVAGGLALAIPSNLIQRFVAGRTRPAFLGVVTQPVRFSTGFADHTNVGQASGLMVLSAEEGSPATRNGLLPGDILIEAGGQRLTDHEALLAVLRACSPGTPLPLTIVRGGSLREVTAILGERDARA